jgi:hypothetical protein
MLFRKSRSLASGKSLYESSSEHRPYCFDDFSEAGIIGFTRQKVSLWNI